MRGILSKWKKIFAGVPQGSLLGPLFYILFTKDVIDEIETSLKLYADDSLLMSTGQTEEEARRLRGEKEPKDQLCYYEKYFL